MRILLLFSFAIFCLTVSSVQTRTCNTFSKHDSYRACNQLPALNAYLYWNYDQSTNTVEIAYRHTGIESNRWVAWAINPTRKGMIGSQSLVAYQNSNGIVHAYTSSVTKYRTKLEEGSLSFQVSKLSAEFFNDEMIVYATIALPTNMTTVNHVWQEGPVNGDGRLGKHALRRDNLKSRGIVDFLSGKVTKEAAAGAGGGSSSVSRVSLKKIHGGISMVTWGTLMPIGAIIARYMKVFKITDPAWFYAHIICQSLAYAVGIGGAVTGLYLGGKSQGIQYDAHKNIGIVLLVLGLLQVLALKLRLNKDHKYRAYWNWYHHGIGYTVIILSIVNIFKGLDILDGEKTWKIVYTVILVVLASIAGIMEVLTRFIGYREGKGCWFWNIPGGSVVSSSKKSSLTAMVPELK